jgi:hypothetical protein
MVEYKFTAQKNNGQTITGTLAADTAGEAKKKINLLAEKNQLKILNTEKKSTFLYKAPAVKKNRSAANKKPLIKRKLKKH